MSEFCYWTVGLGQDAEPLARCVRTARSVGVKEEFHVFTDAPIEGAFCHSAPEVEAPADRRLLVYLLVGGEQLAAKYLIWIAPTSKFRSNPSDPLKVLEGAPFHMPLGNIISPDRASLEEQRIHEIYKRGGLFNPPRSVKYGFWCIKRSAITRVCELAGHVIGLAREQNQEISATDALGFACQMLCGNPKLHRVEMHQDVWRQLESSNVKTGANLPSIVCG